MTVTVDVRPVAAEPAEPQHGSKFSNRASGVVAVEARYHNFIGGRWAPPESDGYRAAGAENGRSLLP